MQGFLCGSGWLGGPQTCLIKKGEFSVCKFTLPFLTASLEWNVRDGKLVFRLDPVGVRQ